MAGNTIGTYWQKNGQVLKIKLITNNERKDVATIIKENIEVLGIKTTIKILNSTKDNINYDILLTGDIVSIKPEIKDYVEFNIEKQETEKDTFKTIYNKFNQNPNFMGLYFNSITVLCSQKLRGNFKGNWYNIFYNIDTWYKV